MRVRGRRGSEGMSKEQTNGKRADGMTLSRREVIAGLAGASVGAALQPSHALGQTSRESGTPNILWIITDQHHVDAISARSCSQVSLPNINSLMHVRTPNIDHLVRGGTFFTSCYCPSSLCAPSRGSMMTGRAPLETGVITNDHPVIKSGMPHVGEWLSGHSAYETLYAGKWHLPGAYQSEISGFKVLQGGTSGHGIVSDPAVAEACADYLRNRRNPKPFFMVASFLQPHDICEWLVFNQDNPSSLRYPELADHLPPLPANFEFALDEPRQLRALRARLDPSRGHWTKEHWQYYMWNYYRHVEQVDSNIGVLLQGLEDSGYADNTAIIFVSDHGEGLAHHQMVRKNFAYDEASRVPLSIMWPWRLPSNQVISHTPVSGLDIVPTICDLAGIAAPPLIRGKTLLPLLRGQDSFGDRAVICDVPGNIGRAVRTSRYKLITYANDPNDMLFDMQSDPFETNNLLHDSDHARVVHDLRARLLEWERTLLPATNSYAHSDAWWRRS